jgi:hypothetical protein
MPIKIVASCCIKQGAASISMMKAYAASQKESHFSPNTHQIRIHGMTLSNLVDFGCVSTAPVASICCNGVI